MPILEVKDIQMHYKIANGMIRAVDGVSFELESGQTLGVVGESGCGKSSLAFTILNILPRNGRIFGGEVLFEGVDLTKLSQDEMRPIRWKKISMIFQAAMNALNPVQRIGDQLMEALLAHEEIGKKEGMERIRKLFDLVGISERRINNYPHEFSAGMKQRAIIAMSLLCNPQMIIADEPTSALDVMVQDQIMLDIKDLQQKFKIAMIMISHDLAMISEACDKIAVMYGGKIMETATTASIFKDTRNPYTFALLRSTPSLKGPKRKLMSLKGTPPSLLNPPDGCRFASRCPHAQELCKKELPPMVEIAGDHYSRCHFAKELDFDGMQNPGER